MSLVDSYITSCEIECQEKNHFSVIGRNFFGPEVLALRSSARHFFPRECRSKRSSSSQEPEFRSRKSEENRTTFRLDSDFLDFY